jgi:hypothetical protein
MPSLDMLVTMLLFANSEHCTKPKLRALFCPSHELITGLLRTNLLFAAPQNHPQDPVEGKDVAQQEKQQWIGGGVSESNKNETDPQ